jgi:CheY-like chemotaxis protein
VFRASGGDEALEITRREKPDLITLDLSMPGRSGIDVFDELRGTSDIASIPVCIITGKPEMRKLIYERPVAPPDGYVDKPVNEEHLLLNVRKILETVHAQ